MEVSEAQREVRFVFRGGLVGQSVSATLWLASALLATVSTPRRAILVLVVGGFFIFPVTTLVLRLPGGPSKLRRENPLSQLGMQVAFVLPLCLPLVAAAAAHRLDWFYPAFMIALGAHHLPFAFPYGMRLLLGSRLRPREPGCAARPSPAGVRRRRVGDELAADGIRRDWGHAGRV